MKRLTAFFALILLIKTHAFAQHVREQDIAYSRIIVREINLHYAGNKSVFGKDCILSTILLDAMKHGAKAYSYEDRSKLVSYDQIQDKLWIGSSVDSCMATFYAPEELYIVELTEKFIFDKNASEFKFIPIELTLFIPSEISSKGIMEPLAVFSFAECTRIFRKDSRAYSAVTEIGQQQINFNEQFLLRSYASKIVKIGTEDDLYFDQRYVNPYKAFMAMKEEENALQEMMYTTYHPK